MQRSVPGWVESGAHDKEAIALDSVVSVMLWLALPSVAVIWNPEPAEAGAVIRKEALCAPAGTVTDAGITAPEVAPLARRVTSRLPVPPETVTVHRVVSPGESARLSQFSEDIRADAVREIVAVLALPWLIAVMVAVESLVTDPAVAPNVAVVLPAATVTEAGTFSLAELLAKATSAPLF